MTELTGKAKGGLARAESLTPEQRHEIAKRAAKMRHSLPKATHGSADHPLQIGDIEIPAYVLNDGTRVLSQRGLQTGIGMSTGGGSKAGEQRLAVFVDGLAQKGINIKDLASRLRNPIRFTIGGGRLAFGYEATILADICDAILAARQIPGALLPQQLHIAQQCEILVRGFARVGIIALVDEATGYQADRARDALAKILEAFIAKELQPWVQTFPVDYYRELFRLRGLPFPADTVKRPQYFGILTNDIVYKRLAPGVLEELKRVTPRDEETGRHKHKLFQRLTANSGYPKLREHLGGVVAVMKLSNHYDEFSYKLNQLFPRYDDTMTLPFEYKPAEDDGKGI
jgi:hypothetical protein